MRQFACVCFALLVWCIQSRWWHLTWQNLSQYEHVPTTLASGHHWKRFNHIQISKKLTIEALFDISLFDILVILCDFCASLFRRIAWCQWVSVWSGLDTLALLRGSSPSRLWSHRNYTEKWSHMRLYIHTYIYNYIYMYMRIYIIVYIYILCFTKCIINVFQRNGNCVQSGWWWLMTDLKVCCWFEWSGLSTITTATNGAPNWTLWMAGHLPTFSDLTCVNFSAKPPASLLWLAGDWQKPQVLDPLKLSSCIWLQNAASFLISAWVSISNVPLPSQGLRIPLQPTSWASFSLTSLTSYSIL